MIIAQTHDQQVSAQATAYLNNITNYRTSNYYQSIFVGHDLFII